MEHEMTVHLTEEEYNTLTTEAQQTGKEIEALIHELLAELRARQLRSLKKSWRTEETDEEYEEREWEKLLSTPQGQHTLDHLLAEARHQIAAGEFEGSEPPSHPLSMQEVLENLYHEGILASIATGKPLSEKKEAERKRLADLFGQAGGKPASEMVIEDRGPY